MLVKGPRQSDNDNTATHSAILKSGKNDERRVTGGKSISAKILIC